MNGKPLSEASPAGAVSLRVLIPFLILFGAGLYEVVGLPHGPTSGVEVPDLASVEATLRSSRPPLDGAIYVTGMLGWLVWVWLVISLILQLGVVVAERLAGGTAFVKRAHGIADLLSAPVVRQAVQASVAGGMVVRVALAGVPVAAAAPTGTTAFIVDSTPAGAPWTSGDRHFWAASEDPVVDAPPGSIVYTVQRGDNLVRIAERFYDDGDKWQLVYEANQGRSMADGRTFDRAGVIQPGWQLIVPDPTGAIETDADGQRWYTVRQGDSLAAISARLLGNEQHWPELFAANQGVRLDERRVLCDPRLIWPGLVLRIPELDVQPSTQAQAAPNSDTRETVGTSATQAASPTAPVLAVAPAIPAAASTPTPTVVEESESAPPTAVVSSTSADTTDHDAAPTEGTGASQSPRLVPPSVGAGAGAAAAIAAVAGTAFVLRRRHRRPRRTQPESDVAVNAGYAEAEPTDEFISGAGSDDLSLAIAIAERLSREVAEVLSSNSPDPAELPLDGAMLAAVRHGRSSTTLLVQGVPMAARQQVIGALPEAATRAFGSRSDVEGMVSVDGDVLVRLTGVVETSSNIRTDTPTSARQTWSVPSTLLRMGLLADRQVFAASWEALSHVLVAAPSGRGAEVVLEGLMASLIARRSPAELGLIVIGPAHSLPDELLGIPHLLEPRVDPHDEAAALALIQLVGRELDDRMSNGRADQPDILLVVPELTDLSAEHCVGLSTVMLRGPRYGVRVLAATEQRAADLVRDCPLLPEFGTRLVLRAADEEESMALLGSGDATELGTGGHMLVRLEGRLPLQALAYRVAPDRLAHLATLIREHAAPIDWWMPQRSEQNSPEGSGAAVETREDAPEEDAVPLAQLSEQSGVVAVPAEHESEENPGDIDGAAEVDGVAGPVEVQSELPLEVETEVEACESIEMSAPPNGRADERGQQVKTTPGPRSNHRSNGTATLAAPSPKLQARFLGARELLYDGKIVWPVAGVPDEAAMELLVFLGVEDPAGVRADLLSDSLWEEDDEDDEDRSYRLRKRRYRLRRALKRLIPGWQGDPIARMDKQTPIYRLDPNVIETDVHCYLKLLENARSCSVREGAVQLYEQALELYRGDLLDRPDVPSYRWLDDGPRVLDLRVKYATFHQLARRRLADLLVTGGTDAELARAEELYKSLVTNDALDHRLWEALARVHGARNDLLGLEATFRRLKGALVEVGEGDDPERVPVPPTLKRVFDEVRARLLAGRD